MDQALNAEDLGPTDLDLADLGLADLDTDGPDAEGSNGRQESRFTSRAPTRYSRTPSLPFPLASIRCSNRSTARLARSRAPLSTILMAGRCHSNHGLYSWQ